ncbi:type II secretion system protein M [Psychromonas sp. RZ22]|uniref:type II secretion system protein GspM n=1 Tax=Psychromonas algarum TaxID=2555643 RepID=UPI0010683EE5|nr:type II secretion system protein M [Psychromonas sp. RZ22]TEW53938.1 type II secretion system protein M [Psychromonas sp. RZ22]
MFEQIKDWWEGTTEREQQLSVISAVVIFVALIYFLLWQPITSNLADQQQRLRSSEQTLQWVETNAAKLVKAGVSEGKRPQRKVNLSQLINNTAKRNNINISRIQNQKNGVDIWINEVEFTQFLRWITALQNDSRVQVVSVDINRQKDQGMIKVNRLSLSY